MALRALLLAVSGAAVLAGCASPRQPPPAPAPQATNLADHLSGFAWPLPLRVDRDVSSPFGARGQRHHYGVDLRARHGDPIFAARGGTVRFAGTMRNYGLTIIIDHGGGVTTLYAHASALYVSTGQWVDQGSVIGAVGATGNATGPHLHFEIAWAGRQIDPVPLLPRLFGAGARHAR